MGTLEFFILLLGVSAVCASMISNDEWESKKAWKVVYQKLYYTVYFTGAFTIFKFVLAKGTRVRRRMIRDREQGVDRSGWLHRLGYCFDYFVDLERWYDLEMGFIETRQRRPTVTGVQPQTVTGVQPPPGTGVQPPPGTVVQPVVQLQLPPGTRVQGPPGTETEMVVQLQRGTETVVQRPRGTETETTSEIVEVENTEQQQTTSEIVEVENTEQQQTTSEIVEVENTEQQQTRPSTLKKPKKWRNLASILHRNTKKDKALSRSFRILEDNITSH